MLIQWIDLELIIRKSGIMDKLNALKYFCIAAETLQFKETAIRLSVSPQVVTRVIAELEQHLGESLFVRNTRNVQLTDFGTQFLPKAQQYLLDGDKLFRHAMRQDEMAGVVRITVPKLPENTLILTKLAEKMADFAQLQLDWRVDEQKLDSVENQIDIGIRISQTLDPLVIAKTIMVSQDKLVMAPTLLAKIGEPNSIDDLQTRFPLSSLLNTSNGRVWGLPINEQTHVLPKTPRFVTNDLNSELTFVLAGQTCALLPDYLCRPYLQTGALVELFADLPRHDWLLYLYRPVRTPTSQRVLVVYGWLKEILLDVYREVVTA